MQQKTIKKKRFTIRPFKQVVIGDPSYLEELPTHPDYKRLVFMRKALPTAKRLAWAELSLVEINYEDPRILQPGTEWQLQFISARRGAGCRDAVETLLSGMYEPDRVKEEKVLGCDTASFYLSIDENGDVIKTGGDGQYGVSILYEKDNLAYFSITLDADLYTEDQMLQYVRYFFEVIGQSDWHEENTPIHGISATDDAERKRT